ncbi:MAG: YjbH domain-containing protein [Syntrophorhabdaceae bacterium]|nr:YjbH domain-containing protein [Syntrophorhabdaceae bacterium]
MAQVFTSHISCPIHHVFFSVAYAADEPFVNPTNWGTTGLIEIPTARVMKENSFRAGIGLAHPYNWYYLVISPVKGLEMEGRITEIRGIPALTTSYGNYKDKAMDFKYQFISEGMYMPAIAVAINDPQGTRLYPSQYLVASKQIYPFDFTLGFGNGRFGKVPLPSSDEGFKAELFSNPKAWMNDGQFFGGIQFSISDKYAIMAEYSPIRYEKQVSDPAQRKYFRGHVPSKFNYAFRWSPYKWTNIIMSYQRGEQIGLNLSVAFDMGQTLLPVYDPPYKEKKKDKENPLSERLEKALYESGFSNIGISIEGRDVIIVAQNDKYFYTTRAIGVILKILNDIAPERTGRVDIILTSNGIPILKYTTTKLDIDEFYAEKLKPGEFAYLSKLKTDVSWTPDVTLKHKKYFDYGINPAFQQFLNDPSGFYKYRAGAYAWVSYFPWRGGTITGGLESYPLNNIKSSVEPSSDPIRTDAWLYMKKSGSLGRLMFDQMLKTDEEIYTRLAGGLLEIQYAGFDGEIARPFFNGRVYMGISGSLVRKRDMDNPLKLHSTYTHWYKTTFLNTRFNVPEIEMSFDFKTGRFLAGDKGTRLTISKFINGIVLSAWYTWTNTTGVFKDRYNQGYHDKGVAITLPLRLFTGYDTKTTYGYAISPWTRDVAQDIYHYSTLFDFFGRNTKIFLDKDRPMIYK